MAVTIEAVRRPLRSMARDLVGRGLGRRLHPLESGRNAVAGGVVQAFNRNQPGRYPIASTITVFGVPRGGSTWVAELLLETPGANVIWEPLAGHRTAHLGVGWRPYVPEEVDWPEGARFLEETLTGRYVDGLVLTHSNIGSLLRTKRWIVKFCRGNRLLPWMVRHLDLRPPIYVVRHPCAVVSSMLRYGAWSHLAPRFPVEEVPHGHLRQLMEPYLSILTEVSSLEERLAATWCLDNLVPLRHPDNNRSWITVSYEGLVVRGEAELERIWDRLGLPCPAGARAKLTKPSATTRTGSPILEGGNQLAGWKRHLKPAQIDAILRVVDAFGMTDVYDDALEPHYTRLGIDA